MISIHAPRVRGDLAPPTQMQIRSISIHAPRVRGDCTTSATVVLGAFQSTPLV